MHVVPLVATRLDGEDHTKDIDFSPRGIRERWEAGYANTSGAISAATWHQGGSAIDGVVVHDVSAPLNAPAAAREYVRS